ncbi:MAG: RNA 3'-terminal phosphate cyclase [Gammaproteobacteria bacterium]|nr:RNA 3'-terminal phosphate cyclase [Gammaproteobacteria bacterium]MDH5803116.1 RNA 3'-terminal phosphate cyclase [Gammaproteobacteria bacterium]
MLQIDGSKGEGGGQILRSSLSMAMVTGSDVHIKNIRAGRSKPGLMRQHLACVKAAQQICNAQVSGAEVGSTEITFKPGAITAGEYEFVVGTAGSTLLIFQTVLPALVLADGESRVKFEGGTHNMFAPSFDFAQLAFVPVLRHMGFDVELQLDRHGFYPQGGGRWQAVIKPLSHSKALDLCQAGALKAKQAVATSVNIPAHVAERELAEVAKCCGWEQQDLRADWVSCLGSGNVLSLRLQHEHCAEVVEYCGKIGVSAEQVAKRAVKALRRYQQSPAAVGEHLADQLLLPMVIACGGVFRTLKPSLHTLTNVDVIHRFTEKRFELVELEKDCWEVQL